VCNDFILDYSQPFLSGLEHFVKVVPTGTPSRYCHQQWVALVKPSLRPLQTPRIYLLPEQRDRRGV
jgi:hypothetical protein